MRLRPRGSAMEPCSNNGPIIRLPLIHDVGEPSRAVLRRGGAPASSHSTARRYASSANAGDGGWGGGLESPYTGLQSVVPAVLKAVPPNPQPQPALDRAACILHPHIRSHLPHPSPPPHPPSPPPPPHPLPTSSHLNPSASMHTSMQRCLFQCLVPARSGFGTPPHRPAAAFCTHPCSPVPICWAA